MTSKTLNENPPETETNTSAFTGISNKLSGNSPLNILSPSSSSKAAAIWFYGIVGALSSFSFGYSIGLTNDPTDLFDQCSSGDSLWKCFRVSKSAWGVMSSQLAVGALSGALSGGQIADRLGRRGTLLLDTLLYVLAFASFAMAPHYIVLFLARLLMGYAVGVACVAVPLYLNEISGGSTGVKSSRLAFAHNISIVFGIVAAQGAYLLLKAENWRIVAGAAAAIHLIQGLLLYWKCPESPKWLASNHQRRSPFLTSNNSSGLSLWQALKSQEARKSLLLAVFLHASQQFSFINAIFFYSKSISPDSPLIPFYLALLNFGMTFVTAALIDLAGRRLLLNVSLAGMAASGLALTLSTHYKLSLVPSLALCSFVAAFSLGLGPIPWLALSEIFPASLISTYSPIAVAVNWISVLIVTALFVPVSNSLGMTGCFALMTGLCSAFLVISLVVMVETKGRLAGFV